MAQATRKDDDAPALSPAARKALREAALWVLLGLAALLLLALATHSTCDASFNSGGCGGPAGFVVVVEQHDGCAPFGEPFGARETDSRCAAGDDGDLVGEVLHD